MTTQAVRGQRIARHGGQGRRGRGAGDAALPTGFRADIQGLRALAVVSVVLGHAGVPGLAGGYVGVDVFFVISGYLITQLLLREAAETGRISLPRFYSRRARRILPAATLVLVATALSSVALLGYVRAQSVMTDEVWSAAFAANVRFGRQETDYFSADAPPSPVQHFWSLAVEEQFYLVWPVVLLLLVLLVRATRRPTRLVGLVLGLASVASLVWCLLLTGQQQQAAYFSTPARAWELALGAGGAVFAPRLSRWPSALSMLCGWLGLGLILAAIVTFTARTPFPGYAALVPTVGAALVIAGGEGTNRGGPSALLGLPWCRRVGDWSYALYLWHWPILILAAGYAGHTLSIGQNLALLGAALVAAALTYRLVENPVRRSRLLSSRTWRGIAVYPAALAVMLVAILVSNDLIEQEAAATAGAPAITARHYDVPTSSGATQAPFSTDPAVALVQASVEAAQSGQPIPGVLSPGLLDLHGDVADVGSCDYTLDVRKLCERGDVGSPRVMVVLGDSHARAWIPALDPIARDAHYAAYYLVKPGCNAGMLTPDVGAGPFTGCVEWRDWAIDQIVKLRPDVLFIASDLPPAYVDPDEGTVDDPSAVARAVDRGMVQTITTVRDVTGRVIIAGDAPGMPLGPGDCLSQRGADLGDCMFARSTRNKLLVEAERDAALATGSRFIDTLPWFCSRGLCPSVVGSTVTYRDTEHITPEYARQLVVPLQHAMGLDAERAPQDRG